MASLDDVQQNWEILAQGDPMWGALMDPAKQGGRWEKAAFFAAGKKEIEIILGYLAEIGVDVDRKGRALDFGCGIGRLSQALAAHFALVAGVDISPTMIARAQSENGYPDRCSYLLNETTTLSQFPDEHFAFIYTSVVLQHMEPEFAAGYVREFTRVLAPGGVAVFQVPDRIARGESLRERTILIANEIRNSIGLRTRGRRFLRKLGLQRGAATPAEAIVEMHCLREDDVRAILSNGGLELIDMRTTNSTDLAFVVGERPDPNALYAVGGLRFLEAEPHVGFVSKQYCAIKPIPTP